MLFDFVPTPLGYGEVYIPVMLILCVCIFTVSLSHNNNNNLKVTKFSDTLSDFIFNNFSTY